jgi:DinB superfamily
MQETPQQYTQRILGYLEGKKPLEILAATPRQIARLVKGVSKKKLSKRPTPQRWSVTEILAHLADSELVHGFRLRLILGASGAPIQGFDQDAWAVVSDYAKHDPALSLEAMRVNRERTVRLLKGLPRDAWDRYGMHSERGKETVARVTEMMAGHDLNHLKAIREILRGSPR